MVHPSRENVLDDGRGLSEARVGLRNGHISRLERPVDVERRMDTGVLAEQTR